MESTDEELVQRAAAGDEGAVEALFHRWRRRLRAQVRAQLPALLRRRVAESDVIQECYLTAFRRLAEFEDRGEGSFGRWLRRILKHKVQDEVRRHLRRRKRAAGREVSRAVRPDTDAFPRQGNTPSRYASVKEDHARALRALEELPEDYRRILRLVHDDGLSVPEAAVHMGRSAEAARKLYGRAAARLAALLGEGR